MKGVLLYLGFMLCVPAAWILWSILWTALKALYVYITEGDKDMTDTMTKNIDTDSPEPPEEAFAFMRPKPRRARITLKKTK